MTPGTRTPNVFCLIDASGELTFLSPAVASRVEVPHHFDVRSALLASMHPDDRAKAVESWDLLLAEPRIDVDAVFRICDADGSWRWIQAVGTNLLDDPRVGSIVVAFRDVTDEHALQEELRQREVRYRTVIQQSYDVVALLDEQGDITWITPNVERMLGWRPDEVEGRNGLEFLHPDDVPLMLEELAAFTSGTGVPNPTTVMVRHKAGHWCHVELVGTDFLANPDLRGIALSLRLVDDRVAAQRQSKRLRDVIELTDDLVVTGTRTGEGVFVNRAAREFFGFDLADELGPIDLSRHVTPTTLAVLDDEVRGVLREQGRWSGELELVRHDDVVVPVLAQVLTHRADDGRVEYVSAIMRDISERKAFELQLAHAATHDALTGLPNRTLLLDRIEMALNRARRHNAGVAVLFCDLDHFKVVNDSRGHSHGDRLLVEVAARLRDNVRPADTVARHGGDEFVVLCEDLEGPHDAKIVAARIVDAFASPFSLDDDDVFIGLSVGIAYSADGVGEADTLIRDADAAMYAAKGSGRNRIQVFEPDMWERAVDRFDLDNALRRALGRGELALLYQPIYSLATDKLVGVEALLRWHHPERGWLSPQEFIAVAEDTGLIVPIGSWVLHEACRQLSHWDSVRPDGTPPLTMAINLSGRQLDRPGFANTVAAALVATGVAAGRLHLEITESVLMRDVEASDALLRRLHRLGVRLAVDDFGTGYSSLSYLRQFPVDALKVDRTFVEGIDADGGDSAIVAAVVNLAHTLGLVAIAEGVETPTQLATLRRLGCDHAQGYLLAHPLPADELTALLTTAHLAPVGSPGLHHTA